MMTFWVCFSCVILGFIGGHWVARKETQQSGWIEGWTSCNDLWLDIERRRIGIITDDKQ